MVEYFDTAPNLKVGTIKKQHNMNFVRFLRTNTIKYFKGLFAISLLWLLPALGIFIFDSCKKSNYENSDSGKTARKFNETMDKVRASLGSTSLINNVAFQSRMIEDKGTYYLDFPEETNPQVINDFSSNANIENLTTILANHGVSIDDSINTDAEVIIQVPNDEIRTALEPLVVEAKNYLISKGATTQQINEMLQEEGAEDIDLIPFVKALTSAEAQQYVVKNITFPFLSEANANKILECGIKALGFDALAALAQSTASAWTWGAIKTAFKTVAKKMYGPIGVAVAVIEFGICMLD